MPKFNRRQFLGSTAAAAAFAAAPAIVQAAVVEKKVDLVRPCRPCRRECCR